MVFLPPLVPGAGFRPGPSSAKRFFPVDSMELPACPHCNSGRLLPFFGESGESTAWICSSASCAYVVSLEEDLSFYKGVARAKPKEGEGERYVEFDFGEEG